MAQCKVPLNENEPNIMICVIEEGHEGLHYTYGIDQVYFSTYNRDRRNARAREADAKELES